MKNVFALFLLVIFTFNIWGSYCVLRIRQFQIRKEIVQKIKQGVSESDLTIFKITPENKNQIIWENNDEFIYKGTLYDVVYTQIIDQNTKVYHCLSDLQETNLIANYDKDLEKNGKNKGRRRNSPRFLKFIPEVLPNTFANDALFSKMNGVANFKYLKSYNPLYLEISSPPPKQIL